MKPLSSPAGLVLKLLERAAGLREGEVLSHVRKPDQQDSVLDAMTELLQGNYALGSLTRCPQEQIVLAAKLFGLTSQGLQLKRELGEESSPT